MFLNGLKAENNTKRPIVGIKSFIRLFGITAALIKVSVAQEERESSSDSEFTAPVTANRTYWIPPSGSTFKVGGSLSTSSLPPHLLTHKEMLQQYWVDRLSRHMDAYDVDLGFIKKHATRNYDHVLALEEDNRRTMPPRRLKQRAVERLVKNQLAKAITEMLHTQNSLKFHAIKLNRLWGVVDYVALVRENRVGCLNRKGTGEDKVTVAAYTLEGHGHEMVEWNITDKKKLEEILIVCDFPEVFSDDFTGLPPMREIELRIDLIPEALPVLNHYERLVGYYRRFIENFSKIAKPLTLLTQKNKKYEWGDKQEEAFLILKEKLCNAPVLALPDGLNDFVVYCDASNQGFGCVLM
ncbi:putative reverse transcriptase domain-containing protein [Tanacetum coccineum]